MPFQTKGIIEVPLEIFGSRCTEMSPTALPEGVSPDEQDNTFIPGGVLTRPCLEKQLTNAPANTTVTYQKSFVLPTGAIKNLYLFSNGQMLWEDPIVAPGTGNALLTVPPGSYAKSATMFGREFIGFSDGLHGTTAALQWDGINLDRVTQDGPAATATVTSVAPTSAQLVASPNTLTRNGNIVTANIAAPVIPPLQIGYQAQISNVPDSNSTTVNQENSSPEPSGQVTSGDWSFVSNNWRSNFNPGTSPLSAWAAGNFGFNIPSNATILGAVIGFQVYGQSATTGTVAQVALWQTGAQIGTAKSPATPINAFPAVTPVTYGSAGDLWGASLTPSIVNDPSFGFAVSIAADSVRVFLFGPFTVTVYYTLSGSGTVAQITSIVVDNEQFPGLALVTTDEPHGLAPEEYVSIVGVEPADIADVSGAQWVTGLTTLTTKTNHNLQPGAVIQLAGVTTATGSTTFSFDGTFTVENVPSPNQLVYPQTPITATDPDVVDATANTGSITLAWPIPADTPTPTYFEVESCPSPTTFYVPLSFSDGTWTSGTVGFSWEGTFYVTDVISPTQFQYQQYGPNGSTTTLGTVTPFGQAAPGFHLMRVNFLTRQDAVLKPSPYVKFIANGGQYLQIDNIPVGPSNIIARILEFTGADGAYFYYLPIPAQVNGQVVSTATQINDNTTTSILLDFSDNSLFGGIGTSEPGNDLKQQIVLDGALGFGQYATRLITYGQRNRVQNLLNMGFEGGTVANLAGNQYVAGWGESQLPASSLVAGVNGIGLAYQESEGALVTTVGEQSAYLDAYGNPIVQPNTLYGMRFYLKTNNFFSAGFFEFFLSSASTSLFLTAVQSTSAATVAGGFFDVTFSGKTPLTIPSDMLFGWRISGGSGTTQFTVDEMSLIYAQTPYLDGVLFGSYGNNPEGIDGVTSKFGPVTDTRKVMDFGVLRETFYMLTQEPSGRLHETTDNGTTEPSGWTVNEVGANCGALSAFSLTKSQADDAAASGGEEWMAWASESGARIFGGAAPDKISQSIQPDWAKINSAAALTVWCVNDPVERALYFGVPLGSATAPSNILFMSYRNLNSAAAIEAAQPIRVGFSGKLIVTDNNCKWSLWNMSMNGAARMYRSAGILSLVLGGGNGLTPGVGGFGNVYTLNPSKYTDDDYGQVSSYYYTYAFVNRGEEQQLQVGSHQKGFIGVLATVTWPAGTMLVQVAPNNPANIWPLSCSRTVSQPNIDLQWGYGNMIIARGSRFFLKFSSVPLEGQTDNAYNLQMVTVALIPTRLKTRGAAQ